MLARKEFIEWVKEQDPPSWEDSKIIELILCMATALNGIRCMQQIGSERESTEALIELKNHGWIKEG